MTSSKIEKKLLHYTGKAIADYQMIAAGDKVMVQWRCLKEKELIL